MKRRGIRALFICAVMLLLCVVGTIFWLVLALGRESRPQSVLSVEVVPTPHWVHIDGTYQANVYPYEVGVIPDINIWKTYLDDEDNSKVHGPRLCSLKHGTRVQMVGRVETWFEDQVQIITPDGKRGWVTYWFIKELKYPLPTPAW